ncbi:MAG: DoxX family membrane protein [Porphyrobacter sp.]|nr:DoxX family membrane protein [Porphyrobacter sp.]
MIDNRLAPYGAFALRAASGALFLAHAGLKLFVFTPAGTAQFFESVGVPGPVAYLTILAEVIGGTALLLGVYTRQAAAVLIAVLLGAIFSVHLGNGFFFNASNGGWEYPAFWIVALAAQMLIGEGAFALKPTAALDTRTAAVAV